MLRSDQCSVCNSWNTDEWYPSDIDRSKLTFSYAKTPECNKTFRVVRCHNCTHVFCSPIPKNIYKNYEDVVDLEYLRYKQSLILAAKSILPIISNYIDSGILLDVGCATGDFLTVARNYGYSVEGLELSEWSSSIAQKKSIRVYRENLESIANRFSNRYDIITMFGVIEHFEHPLKEMSYLKKLLRPDGLLVVWTGDVDSLSSRLLGRLWWYWQGQHIQYFTHSSLNFLARSYGFKNIITKTYPFVATYELLDNSLNRYSLRPWIMKAVRPFFSIKPVWTFYLPGEMLWIGRKTV